MRKAENIPEVFVINLKRDRERLAMFRREMEEKWPDKDYRVVEGVDGRSLSEEEYLDKIDKQRVEARLGREIGRGEVGCVLSMQKIYATMLEEDIHTAMIFEDDAKLGSMLQSISADLVQWLRSHDAPAVLLLSKVARTRVWTGERFKEKFRICRTLSATGGYGYMINFAAASKLLEFNTPISCFADDWDYFQREKIIKVFSVVPALVGNNDFDRKRSNLSDERRQLWLKRQDVGLKPKISERIKARSRSTIRRCFDKITGVTVCDTHSNEGIE